MRTLSSSACADREAATFNYTDEKFADIQLLRYRVEGFEELSLQQKMLIYHLSEAALAGRDILYDQNCRYNLRIRRLLEAVYLDYRGDRQDSEFQAFERYLKRVWFSNGIHHHYGCEKFQPDFSPAFLRRAVEQAAPEHLPAMNEGGLEALCDELFPVIFDPAVLPMRVNQRDGEDLVGTSACNYYGPDVTQEEAEAFYAARKQPGNPRPVQTGLNSRLIKQDGKLEERVWKADGLYGPAIQRIVSCLKQARAFAENDRQREVIDLLTEFYQSGDLKTFDDYCICWLQDTESRVDFTNGFTETYGDPLGLKASWEGIVNFKDLRATERTERLSRNAQWFEDHSPVDARFKKKACRGISAKVITAAMLGGDLYPSTAIGINLPNSNWIRKEYGSKSVTIGNLTDAYNKAAKGSGLYQEFVFDEATRSLIRSYGDLCDDLHTDLHECLGHGSGKLLPGTDADALKAHGSTIEEARADLFGLYYIADPKLTELGLTPCAEAYKAHYYTYLMNGLLTQLARIKPGNSIEEAHMRNRALIARWCLERGAADGTVALVKAQGKTYVRIGSYERLRLLFGELLAEIQRIKSEGDYDAARRLVERYAVGVDPALHAEVLERYERLRLSPYKGFINPVYRLRYDDGGNVTDVDVDYTESYEQQMLRYSRDYRTLPDVND